jgi:hypothetical protein
MKSKKLPNHFIQPTAKARRLMSMLDALTHMRHRKMDE